jgi:predicted ABC-type ATPase
MRISEVRRPRVIVLGGPNGAGKTTCAGELLPHELALRQFVNADTIAAGLSAFAPELVAVEAGRMMLARIHQLARDRADFAFETTLASRSFAPFLRRVGQEGYEVGIVYVWLQSPELALERVEERVRRGGHAVPEETVRRRYWRGLTNFVHLYRPLAESWVLCDNSGEAAVVVARGESLAAPEIFDQELYERFHRAASRSR